GSELAVRVLRPTLAKRVGAARMIELTRPKPPAVLPMLQRVAVVAAFAALATSVLAHDGDPKILDLRPPYQGPGFRSGRPTVLRQGHAAIAAPEFASDGIQLLSWLPLGELGGATSGNSCYGYTSPSGRSYALMGLRNGTVV